MTRQLQIADDLRIEQRHRVGGDRVAEAGMKFLGDGRAAHDCAPLETVTFSPPAAR